jgi:predicted peroxiredoxin
MKKLLSMLIAVMALSLSVFAAEKAPLFVNLTNDGEHRTFMAVQFSMKMLDKGHPLTIYLNDKGVNIASKENKQYAQVQSKLAEVIKKGATVYICPVCMKEYKVEGSALIEGLQIGNANLLEKALFAENTTTMNW